MGELRCPKWEEKREQTNEMQNGGEGEEERRGNANEMQRGWHPTGKVLGNVVGGIVGKLRGGENLMQNGTTATRKKRNDKDKPMRCKMEKRPRRSDEKCACTGQMEPQMRHCASDLATM